MVFHPSQSGSNVFNDTWNNICLNKHLVLATKPKPLYHPKNLMEWQPPMCTKQIQSGSSSLASNPNKYKACGCHATHYL